MVTVLGASGFIGSNLIKELDRRGIAFYAPKRDENIGQKELGHIIYCIGMTADFRTKPFETVESHVCKLLNLLQNCQFESLTYLSSTRLYLKSITSSAKFIEEDDIVINPGEAFDLFAASKITGELLALNSGRPNIKIIRVSNVFGPDISSDNFITAIIREAVKTNKIEMFTTPDSSKDYIALEDVCNSLALISQLEISGVFNLAFGSNTTNGEILKEINRLTGAEIKYSSNAKRVIFKEIDITKLTNQFGFKPTKTVLESLPEIISAFKI